MRFTQFFSLDSPKAIKARAYGYMNAINYMAPAALAGVGNLCPHASPGCLALCLGWHSGQAGMVKGGRTNALNAVRRSRQDKARMFMRDRATFMRELVAGIERAQRKAEREGLKLCVRLNGATDIAWEGVRFQDPIWSEGTTNDLSIVRWRSIRRLHQIGQARLGARQSYASGELPSDLLALRKPTRRTAEPYWPRAETLPWFLLARSQHGSWTRR